MFFFHLSPPFFLFFITFCGSDVEKGGAEEPLSAPANSSGLWVTSLDYVTSAAVFCGRDVTAVVVACLSFSPLGHGGRGVRGCRTGIGM